MVMVMKHLLLFVALLYPSLSAAQSPNLQARFEVAAVNPVADIAPGARIGFEDSPSGVRMDNLSLRALIRMAYSVMDEQVSGPAWLNEAIFDITAKPPAGYQSAQLPTLVRNLLVDRFGLAVHQEKKDVAGFALRVGSNGHRLVTAKGDRTFLTGRPGFVSGNGRAIGDLVPILAQNVGAPVVNETGLSGAYDIKLEWTPQLNAGGNTGEPEVSLFTALREQLGLQLERVRVPADVVVVDRIGRVPTEN
jgi:uncharacterized protein (TIGR03435 family)